MPAYEEPPVLPGGPFLPELSPALAVDIRWHSRSVTCRCIVHHLLHSTAKAHKITAVIEIHAQRQIFFLLFWFWH